MRIAYIDKLKALAIFFVVVGYVSYFSFGLGETSLSRLYKSFYMPLFFFLSGIFVFHFPLNLSLKYVRSFLKKKILRIMVPFFSFGGLYAFLTNENFDVVHWYVHDSVMYWFLPVLFSYMLVALFIEFVSEKIWGNRFYNDLISFSLIFVLIKFFIHLQPDDFLYHYLINFTYWIHYFMFGMFFAKYSWVKNMVENSNLLYSLCLIAWISYIFVDIPLVSFASIVVLVQIFKKNDLKIPSFMSTMGTFSLEIYAIHYFLLPVLSPVGEWLREIPLGRLVNNGNMILEFLLSSSLALPVVGISILVSRFIKHGSITNAIFFGVSKEG